MENPVNVIETDFDETTLGDFLDHLETLANEHMTNTLSCEINSPRRNLTIHLKIEIKRQDNAQT